MGGSFSMELTINNITKQYGNVTVLDDVSYRFTPGIYGILGANGAGKTTLFNFLDYFLSLIVFKILMELKIANKATPTSAKIASFILINPSAPNKRKPTFTNIINTIF